VKKVAIILGSLIVAMAVGFTACGSSGYYPAPPPGRPSQLVPSPQESPPLAPSNLRAQAISHNTVELWWTDNSGDEDGFRIYCNNNLIDTVHSDITTYQDHGLNPAETYSYTVKAYNTAGESHGCSTSVKTPNPPIAVRLDRIGVYDISKVEHWLRGEHGEVYLYVVVTDGNSVQQKRFPPREGEHYSLAKNETADVGTTLFSVDEVGDSLTITVVAYESDGGTFEQLVCQGLAMATEIALESHTGGAIGGILAAFNLSLAEIFSAAAGMEDDLVGSYEHTWTSDENWGVGNYADITSGELRLWFTIEMK